MLAKSCKSSFNVHYVKRVQIQSFSGPYFPIFSPEKCRPEKIPYMDTFHVVLHIYSLFCLNLYFSLKNTLFSLPYTAQKMKFLIKDFFGNCDQIQ